MDVNDLPHFYIFPSLLLTSGHLSTLFIRIFTLLNVVMKSIMKNVFVFKI